MGDWQPNPRRSLSTNGTMRYLRREDLELDLSLRYPTVSGTFLLEAIRAARGGIFPALGRPE